MGHERVFIPAARPWPALNGLLDDVLQARRRIAAAQADEARLFARAVDLVAERVEERRRACSTPEEFLRDGGSDLPMREISLELGMAIRVSDRTVQSRMGQAWTLVERFPATLTEWESGAIDAGHVWAIVQAGATIGDAQLRARYEQRALDAAATESPARFAAVTRAIAATVDPESCADLIDAANAERRVRLYPLADGLARLVADLPAPLAHAIYDRLTTLAASAPPALSTPSGPPTPPAPSDGPSAPPAPSEHDAASTDAGAPDSIDAGTTDEHTTDEHTTDGHTTEPCAAGPDASTGDRNAPQQRVVTGPGPRGGTAATASPASPDPASDSRSVDQRRADAFAELLLTGAAACHGDGTGAVAGRVQVTVPVLTLAGANDEPPLLAGYGPVDARLVRRLAAKVPGWDRVLTDAPTGLPLSVDRYRPNAQLIRYLEARDERCRTPGCSVPAHRCDKDHTIDAAQGGPTEAGNLAHICRRHHIGKHHTAWRVRQLGGGVLEWTGPSGRSYLDRPPATVRFVPADIPADTPADDGDPPF